MIREREERGQRVGVDEGRSGQSCVTRIFEFFGPHFRERLYLRLNTVMRPILEGSSRFSELVEMVLKRLALLKLLRRTLLYSKYMARMGPLF